MAERTPGLSAFGDASNINFFGLDNTDQQEEYRNILQNSVDALQMRYAQPNWWKVAAGFAKPLVAPVKPWAKMLNNSVPACCLLRN